MVIGTVKLTNCDDADHLSCNVNGFNYGYGPVRNFRRHIRMVQFPQREITYIPYVR